MIIRLCVRDKRLRVLLGVVFFGAASDVSKESNMTMAQPSKFLSLERHSPVDFHSFNVSQMFTFCMKEMR